jgi:hypothetical protein
MSERVAPRTWYTEAVIGTGADGLSNEIDGKGYRLAKIFMPAEWTTADITFTEAPVSGGTYKNLYANGVEVTEDVAASRTITIDINSAALTAMAYFKIRSGTSGTPVQQAASRTIGLLFVG